MENSIAREEPTLDNRPDPSFGRGSQRLVYLLLMALGGVLVSLGAYARWRHNESWLPELCIALGVAIAAPGVLSYLYRRYMLEEIKLEIQRPAQEFKEAAVTMVDKAISQVVGGYRSELSLLSSASEAGLIDVHRSRKTAIEAFLRFIDDEGTEILVVGSSLKGLLQEDDPEYIKARALLKAKKLQGVRIRFLMTHPIVADLRARQENRNFTDIGKEIIDSLGILVEDFKLGSSDIKLYRGTPTCFGVKTRSAMLLNTYPYGREAFTSPCFIVKKGGWFYDHFDASHFRAWGSAMAVEMPCSIDELRGRLPEYAQRIEQLLSGDKQANNATR